MSNQLSANTNSLIQGSDIYAALTATNPFAAAEWWQRNSRSNDLANAALRRDLRAAQDAAQVEPLDEYAAKRDFATRSRGGLTETDKLILLCD